MYKPYTQEEIKFILENFETKKLRDIAQHIGRTYGSLNAKIYEMRSQNHDFRRYYDNIMAKKKPDPKITQDQLADFLKDKIIPPKPQMPDWLERQVNPKKFKGEKETKKESKE